MILRILSLVTCLTGTCSGSFHVLESLETLSLVKEDAEEELCRERGSVGEDGKMPAKASFVVDIVGRTTQVCRNYTTPHKTQIIDTTINLLVNRTEYTNLSGTTLTLRLAVKSDNSSPAILFHDSEKLNATIKLSLILPTHSCRCPHGRTKSCFTHNNFSKFHKLRSL